MRLPRQARPGATTRSRQRSGLPPGQTRCRAAATAPLEDAGCRPMTGVNSHDVLEPPQAESNQPPATPMRCRCRGRRARARREYEAFATSLQGCASNARGRNSFNVAGIAYAGMPAVMFGRNERVAWGITNNICSQRDLYQERTDPRHPGCFLYDGKWEPAREYPEVIRVKGGYVTAAHGPLLAKRTDRG